MSRVQQRRREAIRAILMAEEPPIAEQKDLVELLIQHTGFRLAGAVGHLARAQVLLAEELEGLPRGSKQETASPAGKVRNEDDTPVEGIRRD